MKGVLMNRSKILSYHCIVAIACMIASYIAAHNPNYFLHPGSATGLAHIQLRGPNQSGTTCGSHAYLSQQAVDELIHSNDQTRAQARSALLDANIRAEQLGIVSREIAILRANPTLKALLETQLKARINPTLAMDVKNALTNELGTIAHRLLSVHSTGQQNSVTCTVSMEQLLLAARERVAERQAPLRYDDCGNYFIDNGPITVQVSTATIDTNWITGDEILNIISSDKDKGSHIFMCGRIEGSTTPLTMDPLLEEKEFKEFLKKFRDNQSDCTGRFLVYTQDRSIFEKILPRFVTNFFSDVGTWLSSPSSSEQPSGEAYSEWRTAQASANDGHWYTVVANKIGNQRQYVIVDSLNNTSRFTDKRFLELKQILEGNSVQSSTGQMCQPGRAVELASHEVVEYRSVTEDLGLPEEYKSLMDRHPILSGIAFVGLCVLAYNKLRHQAEEDEEQDSINPQFLAHALMFRSGPLPLGPLHEPHPFS